MLGFLTKVSAVIAAGAPVFLLLLGLLAVGSGVYAAYTGVSAVSVGMSQALSDGAEEVVIMMNHVTSETASANTGEGVDLLPQFLFKLLALDQFFIVFGISVLAIADVITAALGIVGTLFLAVTTIYLYRKARMFANIVTGTGVHE